MADYGVLSYDTVIIDMSGLPASLHFALIQLFLHQSLASGPGRFDGNLIVVVAEDAAVDERIAPSELGRPSVLTALGRMEDPPGTVIWIPVLGAGASEELVQLREMLKPQEVCPVVPFPSSRSRRGDDLVVEHGEFLFDHMQFEPRNVLYASESNPFDLYRQLVLLAQRYRKALAPLGPTTIVASEHGSKPMSLGVLPAAHDARIVVAQAEPAAYELGSAPEGWSGTPVLHAAWLTGAPYSTESRGA